MAAPRDEDPVQARLSATVLSTAMRVARNLGEDVRSVRSIIPEFGVRGSYRVANSSRIRGVLQAIGAGGAWENAGLRAMYGLHLVAHAQKSRG